MDINVTGISPMDGVTSVPRIGTYPSTPNSEAGQVKPASPDILDPAVKLSLSPEARQLSKADAQERAKGKSTESGESKSTASGKAAELSKVDQATIRKLEARDLHVKMHEQQHLASAGPYAKGSPSFTYQMGPDGKTYAIGGEVQLDVGPVPNNPQATIAKAQIIRSSALAPSDPSGADRSIAAAASQMEAQARMELQKDAQPGNKSQTDSTAGTKNESRQQPFWFKAYQKIKGLVTGHHLNLQA